MPSDENSSCVHDTVDVAAGRSCAILAAAMMFKPIQGTFFTACLLAENDVKIKHALRALTLH